MFFLHDDDPVVNGKRVRRQPGNVPGADGHGFSQDPHQGIVLGAGDAPALAQVRPLLHLVLSDTHGRKHTRSEGAACRLCTLSVDASFTESTNHG